MKDTLIEQLFALLPTPDVPRGQCHIEELEPSTLTADHDEVEEAGWSWHDAREDGSNRARGVNGNQEQGLYDGGRIPNWNLTNCIKHQSRRSHSSSFLAFSAAFHPRLLLCNFILRHCFISFLVRRPATSRPLLQITSPPSSTQCSIEHYH